MKLFLICNEALDHKAFTLNDPLKLRISLKIKQTNEFLLRLLVKAFPSNLLHENTSHLN